MIGIVNEDGSVTATYCHYDGYLEGNGRTLVDNYNSPNRARAVAESGYLSALNENLNASIESSVHKNEKPVVYASVKVYMKCGYNHAGADYLYLFDGAVWFYAAGRQSRPRFEEVEMNLDNIMA
jgi:hypothetical protein